MYEARIHAAIIGLAFGVVTIALVVAIAHVRAQRDTLSTTAITAPCLIADISNGAVQCRVGPQTLPITLGKFFPDGRFQLTAISEARTEFTATRVTDRQSVVFQLDRNPSITGALTK